MRRRLTRKEKRNKTKKILITTSVSFLFIMVVGYAAFNTQLSLKAKGNILKKTITPENLKENIVDTGDGLYKDIYEEGRYIYKGTNPNNYIEFNNELWRIISVENDNALKIIKTKSIGTLAYDNATSCDIVAFRNYKINNNEYYSVDNIIYLAPGGSESGCNKWERRSDLNVYLNETYIKTMDEKLIIPYNWSVGIISNNNSNLVEQIVDEKATVWNGKIGLISVSEYIKANSNISQCGNFSLNNQNIDICKKSNWIWQTLYKGLSDSNNNIWLINGNDGAGSWGNMPYIVSSIYNGKLSWTVANNGDYTVSDVFPSLYLSPDITLKGEGTQTNPYIIENS